MPKTQDLCLLFCLVAGTNACYKQWIPDTNYENESNWNTGVVPCGNDQVQFPAHRKVSVYVETTHSVQELRLPVGGEFILNSGAGFYVGGGQEPGCGAGAKAQFKDSDSLQWWDPALWRAAASLDDLEEGRPLFSVHEESVPCWYDDVIFRASSSFRVDTTSRKPDVPVKSVSVLGRMFNRKAEFSQYLRSRSGRLQFHGSSTVSVGGSGCADPSGCECGNSANRERICATVTCPPLTCKKPLRPEGHCCYVCGVLITIQYATGFNLQAYKQRLQNLFLVDQAYKSVQLAMSKVSKPQYVLRMVPFGVSATIQVVILDGETGSEAGTVAEKLAWAILNDAHSQGSNLGISEAELEASSGSSSANGPGVGAGAVTGAVFGILILVALVSIGAFLVHKGFVQIPKIPMPSMPSVPSLRSSKKDGHIGDLGGPLDLGFDNPMFDKPSMLPAMPTLYNAELKNSISMTQTGVHFVNPVYDENETDFSV